ncbi:MAG TPA: cytochrome-c oxidase, cbb3-type subunit III [Gammaproteobacteria bacterium]|nr:cytochrome-c oxidase, cbb3-type subunit III [Gammaproteobacteria bacterium]
MASLPTGFWGGWIVVITVVTLIGLVWLVFSVYFARDASADVAEQVWDETLREGATPAPLWWFWFILALLAVSVVYLMLYPGLGTYRGALRWSQGGQIAASVASYEERFGPERSRIAAAPVQALQADADAMRSAWHVFNNHCTACHGPDARGQAQLFPNLADDSWQWGGDAQQLEQTITLGRQAVMPPWVAVLNDEGVAQVAEHVLTLAGGGASAAAAAPSEGGRLFQLYCTACHGPDGAGVAALGGPALNDDVWLYGGNPEAVRTSIALGRTGVMPAFGERLDAAQIKMLTAWLASGAAPQRGQ